MGKTHKEVGSTKRGPAQFIKGDQEALGCLREIRKTYPTTIFTPVGFVIEETPNGS
jgi:hypothetical protein